MLLKITEEIENKIVELIQCHTQKKVSNILHIGIPSIQKVLKKRKIKLPKSRINMSHLNVDIDYFKKIDTPKKAYWIGFICADGSINKTNSRLSLIVKDCEILEKFKKDIQSEHKLSESRTFDKRTKKYYHRYSLQITNSLFTQNIISNGVTNKKSDILSFPKIDENFYSYFIAGLFDGDGSVMLNKHNKRLQCNLISTIEILSFIQDILYKKFDIKTGRLYRVTKNKNNVYKLYLYGNNAIKFLDYIYQGDSEIYLSRKYNKYKENRNNEISRKRHQPVIAYDDNGNKIFTFSMMKEAEEKLNATWDGIHRSYVNNKKYKGYYWKYE